MFFHPGPSLHTLRSWVRIRVWIHASCHCEFGHWNGVEGQHVKMWTLLKLVCAIRIFDKMLQSCGFIVKMGTCVIFDLKKVEILLRINKQCTNDTHVGMCRKILYLFCHILFGMLPMSFLCSKELSEFHWLLVLRRIPAHFSFRFRF